MHREDIVDKREMVHKENFGTVCHYWLKLDIFNPEAPFAQNIANNPEHEIDVP